MTRLSEILANYPAVISVGREPDPRRLEAIQNALRGLDYVRHYESETLTYRFRNERDVDVFQSRLAAAR